MSCKNDELKNVKEAWNSLKEFKRESLDIERKILSAPNNKLENSSKISTNSKTNLNLEKVVFIDSDNSSIMDHEIKVLNDSKNDLVKIKNQNLNSSNTAKLDNKVTKRHVTNLENKKFTLNTYAWRDCERIIEKQLASINKNEHDQNSEQNLNDNQSKNRKITNAPRIENNFSNYVKFKHRVQSAPNESNKAKLSNNNDKKAYDPKEVKKFIEEKKRERQNQIKGMKEKVKKEQEEREMKLKELYRKQRETIINSKQTNQKPVKVLKQLNPAIKRDKSLDEISSNKLNNLLNENDLILNKKHKEVQRKTEYLLQQYKSEPSINELSIEEDSAVKAPTPKPRESKELDIIPKSPQETNAIHKQEKIKNICSLALDLTEKLEKIKFDLLNVPNDKQESKHEEPRVIQQNSIDPKVINFRNMFKLISSQSQVKINNTVDQKQIMAYNTEHEVIKPRGIKTEKKPFKDRKKPIEKRFITIEDKNYNFINIFTRKYGYIDYYEEEKQEKPTKKKPLLAKQNLKSLQSNEFISQSSDLISSEDNLRQSVRKSISIKDHTKEKTDQSEISEDSNLKVKDPTEHDEDESNSSSTLSSSSTLTPLEHKPNSQPIPKQFDVSSSEDEKPFIEQKKHFTKVQSQSFRFIAQKSQSMVEEETQIERYSPNSLERLLYTGLNYLDNLNNSVVQLEELDKVRSIGLAQQEMVTMSQFIKNGPSSQKKPPHLNHEPKQMTQANVDQDQSQNDVSITSTKETESDKSELFEKFKSNEYAKENLSNLVFKKILQEEKIQLSHEDYLLKLRERVIIEKAHEELNWLAKLKKKLISEKQEHKLPFIHEKEKLIHETLKKEQDEIRKYKNKQREELEIRLKYLTKFKKDDLSKKIIVKTSKKSASSTIVDRSISESSTYSTYSDEKKSNKKNEKSIEISTTIKTQMDKSDSSTIKTDIVKESTKKTASSIPESVNTSSDESDISTEDFVDETKEVTKSNKSNTQQASIQTSSIATESSIDFNRIEKLQTELNRKKREAKKLKTDLRKKELRHKEEELKKKIQNYDTFINKAKTNLEKDAKIDSRISLSLDGLDSSDHSYSTQTRSIRKKSRKTTSSIEEDIKSVSQTYDTNFESETQFQTKADKKLKLTPRTAKTASIEEHLNTDSETIETNIDTNVSKSESSPIKKKKLSSVKEHATEKSSDDDKSASATYDTNFETYQSESEQTRRKNVNKEVIKQSEKSIEELDKSVLDSISSNVDDETEVSTRKDSVLLETRKPRLDIPDIVIHQDNEKSQSESINTSIHEKSNISISKAEESPRKFEVQVPSSETQDLNIDNEEKSESDKTTTSQRSDSQSGKFSIIAHEEINHHSFNDEIKDQSKNELEVTESDSISTNVIEEEGVSIGEASQKSFNKSRSESKLSDNEPKTDELQTIFIRKLDKNEETKDKSDSEPEYSIDERSLSSRPPSRRGERSRVDDISDDKSEHSKSYSRSQKLIDLKEEIEDILDESSSSSVDTEVLNEDEKDEQSVEITADRPIETEKLHFGEALVEREKAAKLIEPELFKDSLLDIIKNKKLKNEEEDEEEKVIGEFEEFIETDYKFDEYNELDELSQELSRLTLPTVSYKIINTNQLDDYQELSSQILDDIFERIEFYNFPISKDIFEFDDSNEVRKKFKVMIGDLIIELLNDLYRDTYTESVSISEFMPNVKVNSKKLYFKLNSVAPKTFQDAKILVKSKLNELLSINKEINLKRNKPKLRSKRKYDLVDYLLDNEMRADENDWNHYAKEVIEAKNFASETVFNFLINDTIELLKNMQIEQK